MDFAKQSLQKRFVSPTFADISPCRTLYPAAVEELRSQAFAHHVAEPQFVVRKVRKIRGSHHKAAVNHLVYSWYHIQKKYVGTSSKTFLGF